MDLSDYIKKLQDKLEKYGDGEVYVFGECAEHYIPYIEEDIESVCTWNEEKQDTEWKTTSVKYRICWYEV